MNKDDRKELESALDMLREAHQIIETLAEQEREKYDNMPEGLQNGERGQAISEAADALEESSGHLDDAINRLEEIE
jgi:hypothetical protein